MAADLPRSFDYGSHEGSSGIWLGDKLEDMGYKYVSFLEFTRASQLFLDRVSSVENQFRVIEDLLVALGDESCSPEFDLGSGLFLW